MRDLGAALGLVLVIEGAIYALAPEQAQRFMRRALEIAPRALRIGGLAAVAGGFLVVWLVRGA